MSWIAAVLWAVLTGVAAGINPDWQSALARQYRGEKPATGKPPADAHASQTPSEKPAPQVQVDIPEREGEFPSGVAFASGPRLPRTAQPGEDGGRRKRRTAKAAPADNVCARCKAAIERDLEPVDVAALARAQEAEGDEATSTNHVLKDPEQAAIAEREDPAPAREQNASLADPPTRHRGPIRGRLTTTLATRGALTRMVDRATATQPTGE